jgi:hypothetical protein
MIFFHFLMELVLIKQKLQILHVFTYLDSLLHGMWY